jgi:hypothetical protein
VQQGYEAAAGLSIVPDGAGAMAGEIRSSPEKWFGTGGIFGQAAYRGGVRLEKSPLFLMFDATSHQFGRKYCSPLVP